ncbi:hypothetical protein [Gordonia sp. FQ]
MAGRVDAELRGFNVGRQKYRLSDLWVMSRGTLTKIDLDAD